MEQTASATYQFGSAHCWVATHMRSAMAGPIMRRRTISTRLFQGIGRRIEEHICGKMLLGLTLGRNRVAETPRGTQAEDRIQPSAVGPTNGLSSAPARPERARNSNRWSEPRPMAVFGPTV